MKKVEIFIFFFFYSCLFCFFTTVNRKLCKAWAKWRVWRSVLWQGPGMSPVCRGGSGKLQITWKTVRNTEYIWTDSVFIKKNKTKIIPSPIFAFSLLQTTNSSGRGMTISLWPSPPKRSGPSLFTLSPGTFRLSFPLSSVKITKL